MKFKSKKYPNLRVNYKDGKSVQFENGEADVKDKALQTALGKREDVEKVAESSKEE